MAKSLAVEVEAEVVEEEEDAEEEKEEKEEEEKEDEEEDEEATDIKSNNPHLAGGESLLASIEIPTMWMITWGHPLLLRATP